MGKYFLIFLPAAAADDDVDVIQIIDLLTVCTNFSLGLCPIFNIIVL